MPETGLRPPMCWAAPQLNPSPLPGALSSHLVLQLLSQGWQAQGR